MECFGGLTVGDYDSAMFAAHWQVQSSDRPIDEVASFHSIASTEVLQAIERTNSNRAADLQNIRSDLIPPTIEVAALIADVLNICVEALLSTMTARCP